MSQHFWTLWNLLSMSFPGVYDTTILNEPILVHYWTQYHFWVKQEVGEIGYKTFKLFEIFQLHWTQAYLINFLMILRTRSPELIYEQGRKKVEWIDFLKNFLKYTTRPYLINTHFYLFLALGPVFGWNWTKHFWF